MRISEAAPLFLLDPANRFSTSTRSTYRHRLTALSKLLGDPHLDKVTERDIVRAVSAATSDAYRRSHLTTYRSFFSWASWQGHTDSDPTQHIGRAVTIGNRPVKAHTWLDEDAAKELLEGLPTETPVDRRNRVLIQVALTTGLRRAELANITFADVDSDRGSVRIVGKGGKLAEVALTEKTRTIVDSWKAESPGHGYLLPRIYRPEPGLYTIDWDSGLSTAHISRTVKKVTGLAAHDLRRSYAGIIQDRLGDIVKTSQALRHSNVGTTQRYLESRQDAAYLVGREAGLDL